MEANVSVIIPCFNAEKFISNTIESILNQTIKPKEIVVINDGSTDNTANILSKYNKYLKIINIQNSGVSVARNIGIKQSKAKYIAFCDADDLWHDSKLERQLNFMNQKKAKFLCTNSFLLGNSSENFTPLSPPNNPISFKDLIFCNYIYTSSVIVERSVLDDIGYFWKKLKNLQDWHLWLRIALKYDIYFLDEKLIYYRLHSGGISKNFLKSIYYANLLFDDIFKKVPKYRNLKKKAILSFYINYGTIAYYYGDYNASFKIFMKCLLKNPIMFKSYKYLLLSLLRSILVK